MKKFDIKKLTAAATDYNEFGCSLITPNNMSDYVYNNAQQLVEFSYDGRTIFSVLWQNGISFLYGDYNLPDPDYDVYTDGDGIERKIDGYEYLDDDEMAELCQALSELTGAEVTPYGIADIRDVIYAERPDDPSIDVDDYVYTVDIIEWIEEMVEVEYDYKQSYPTVKESKADIYYDDYCELCKEYGYSNVKVTEVKPL